MGSEAEWRSRSEDKFGRFRLGVREAFRAIRRAIRLCLHNRECKRNRSLPSQEDRWNWSVLQRDSFQYSFSQAIYRRPS